MGFCVEVGGITRRPADARRAAGRDERRGSSPGYASSRRVRLPSAAAPGYEETQGGPEGIARHTLVCEKSSSLAKPNRALSDQAIENRRGHRQKALRQGVASPVPERPTLDPREETLGRSRTSPVRQRAPLGAMARRADRDRKRPGEVEERRRLTPGIT